MQHALLVINPKSRNGHSEELTEAIDLLRNSGIEVEVCVTESPSHMASCIENYSENKGVVIVAGGDGTISSALESIYKSEQTLAILPMGTANDLARSLGISHDVVAAAQAIVNDKRERINLAKVNHSYFVNVAHVGLGVEVTRELTSEMKKYFGVFAYLGAFTSVMKRNKSFKVQIEADGWKESVRAIHLAVGNGRYYGGGNVVDDDSTLLDGQLNLFCLKPIRWWRLLLLGVNFRNGNLQKAERVVCKKARKISIKTSRAKHIQADGEFKTDTPANFEVMPKAIEAVVGDMPLPNVNKD
ncbi:lipid kinase [Idiomarina abyssalis]|uniref:Lipid kinase n=1 Tax=Idiomarina abyssalis TaxID=86102 RepID=A0A8I1G675_9GAMM|nr:lipid kinase [Idiomarina abyssalis]MBJ7268059.1 lipid kinase [Idiomarina abyssalis]MBJ7272558.1 lipid kinase [Idiomarina abyssalis]MBJ7316524.1 lipid kinase [Idiomarina abyssalis]